MNDSPRKSGPWLKFMALGVVVLAVAANFGLAHHRALQRARKKHCLGNMASMNLAGRMWSSDHDERMPRTLTEMSNELTSPKVLFCLADPGAQKLREQISSWSQFDERRCSYEIVNPGISETNHTNAFIRCKAHGHLGYVDGSVFDGKHRLSGHEAKSGTPAPNASTNKF